LKAQVIQMAMHPKDEERLESLRLKEDRTPEEEAELSHLEELYTLSIHNEIDFLRIMQNSDAPMPTCMCDFIERAKKHHLKV